MATAAQRARYSSLRGDFEDTAASPEHGLSTDNPLAASQPASKGGTDKGGAGVGAGVGAGGEVKAHYTMTGAGANALVVRDQGRLTDLVEPDRAEAQKSEARGASKWYRSDIDGLRGVAVLAVVLFHFGFDVPGGFAGVDVFFVISGYLITTIQLDRLRRGVFSVRSFWARRVRRLFWALAAMLAILLVAAHHVLLARNGDYASLLAQAQATLLFGANFWYYRNLESYFFDPVESPLLHCWSLAVEEQYYLLYPLLLSGVWRCAGRRGYDRGRRVLLCALVAVCVPSLWVSVALSDHGDDTRRNFAFYLLPARAWEMALGGLLVTLDHWRSDGASARSRACMAAASWAGLGMVVASFWLYSHDTLYPGSAALLPCVGTAVVIATSRSEGSGPLSAGRLLALRPAVFLGKISYSLYIWHWPIYTLLAYSAPEASLDGRRVAAGLCASAAAAILSYFAVENFFRNPTRVPNRVFWPLSIGVWVALLAFASAGSGGVEFGGAAPHSANHTALKELANELSKAPVDCVMSGWSEWGMCTVNCGGGVHTRTRNITVGANHGGVACPPNHSEEATCNDTPCSPCPLTGANDVSCAVSNWSDWSACTLGCTPLGETLRGEQSRSRTITVSKVCAGETCPVLTASRVCNTQTFPVNASNCTRLRMETYSHAECNCPCVFSLEISTSQGIVVTPQCLAPDALRPCLPFLLSTEVADLYRVPAAQINAANVAQTEPWTQNIYAQQPYFMQSTLATWDPSGGIVHLGDSHCQMMGPLMEKLSAAYGRRVATFCNFEDPHEDNHREIWGAWSPDLIVVSFLHTKREDSYWWPIVKSHIDIVMKWALSNANTKVLFLGDQPYLPGFPGSCKGICSSRAALARFKAEGSWEWLTTWEEKFPQSRALMNRDSRDLVAQHPGRVFFADIAPYFLSTPDPATGKQHPQIVDPVTGRLDYKDSDHLNARGSQRVEQLFRRHIFNDSRCSESHRHFISNRQSHKHACENCVPDLQ